MGFTRHLLGDVIRARLQATGRDFEGLRELAEAAIAAGAPATTNPPAGGGDNSTVASVAAAAAGIPKPADGAGSTPAEVPAPGRKTSGDKPTCNVCLTDDVAIVFLPCGHACSCAGCARKLDKCPICRQPIKATVRVYI